MWQSDQPGLGLYVHIPFCPQRCPYCAFAVVTGYRDQYTRYVDAVCEEMTQWQALTSRRGLSTVFLGGGTPSMLSPPQIEQILNRAHYCFGVEPGAEITLEANPSTVDTLKFSGLREAGVNRLSLGVQAFNDVDLKALGRLHGAAEAEAAVVAARQAGFDNLNIDLMFSVPGVPRSHWRSTLERVVQLRPEHVSAYSLTIEEGTRLSQRVHDRRLKPVSESEDTWGYLWCREQLQAAGYKQYEVSNYAQIGSYSRHNWGYWQGAAYIGVGMSAHAFLGAQRYWNTADLSSYLKALESGHSPCAGSEVLDTTTLRFERLMLQLRTCQGVVLTADELSLLCPNPRFQGMLDEGLIQLEPPHLSLPPNGLLLADEIAVEIIHMIESGMMPPHPSKM